MRPARQPRRDGRGPLLAVADPVTDHHRRHTISQPQPVTLSDLIDRFADGDEFDAIALNDRQFTDAQWRSATRVTICLQALREVDAARVHLERSLARLSPEERAEYDRRTT